MTQSLAEDFTEETRRLTRRWERERRARLEAEAIAERGLREFYEKKEQLQLLEAIATNEPRSVEDALQFALTRVCQTTGWSLGHAYVVTAADNGRRLHSTAIWNDSTAESMRAFRYETELTHFDPSIGLPGRVLATGAPAWIADVVEDGNFPRTEAAQACGIRAAFAFPVLVGREVASVLEFFTGRPESPDETLLHLMAQIGTQLGRVVERKRTEGRLIHDASHDPLTKLPNRALFLDRLSHAVARNRRHPQAGFAVLFIDLDRFKMVNDSLGHHAGDDLILQVAARFSASLRQEDLVARAGGGYPEGLGGHAIPVMAWIMNLAQTLEVFYALYGPEAAIRVARQRRRQSFDPELVKVAVALGKGGQLWQGLDAGDSLAQVVALSPPRGNLKADDATLDNICEAFAEVIDVKSHYTYNHSTGVTRAAVGIATTMGLDPGTVTLIRRAALLHDVGKLSVPNSILEKPGKLTTEEWECVRRHPYYTYAILSRIAGFEELAEIAAAHHEKLDGSGYYRGLTAEQLPRPARLLAVADIFDALAAERPYRIGLPLKKVFEIMRLDALHGLDADCVEALIHHVGNSGPHFLSDQKS